MRKNDLLVLLGCTVVFPGLYATSMSSNSHSQKHAHQSQTISTSQSQNMQVQQDTWSSGKTLCTILASLLLLTSVGAWWLAGGLAFIVSASCGTLGLLLSGISAFGFKNSPSPAPVSQQNAQTNPVSKHFISSVSYTASAHTPSSQVLSKQGQLVFEKVQKGQKIDLKNLALNMSDVQELYLVCRDAIQRLVKAYNETAAKFSNEYKNVSAHGVYKPVDVTIKAFKAVVEGYNWSAQFTIQRNVLHVKNGSSFIKNFGYEELLKAWNAAKDNQNHIGTYDENKKIYDAWVKKTLDYINNLQPLYKTLHHIQNEHHDVYSAVQRLNDVKQKALNLQSSQEVKNVTLTKSQSNEVIKIKKAIEKAEKNLNQSDEEFMNAVDALYNAQEHRDSNAAQLDKAYGSVPYTIDERVLSQHSIKINNIIKDRQNDEIVISDKEAALSQKKESFIQNIDTVIEKYEDLIAKYNDLIANPSQKIEKVQTPKIKKVPKDIGPEAISPTQLNKHSDVDSSGISAANTPDATPLHASDFDDDISEKLMQSEELYESDEDDQKKQSAPTSTNKKARGRSTAKQNRPSSAKKSANTTRIGRGQHAQSAKSS